VEELWNVKSELIEQLCFERANNRSVDPGNEVIKVLTDAAEVQMDESREDNAWKWRWTSVYSSRVISRGCESNVKVFELDQRGQASGRHFGCNISSTRYVPELKKDKVMRRPKKVWCCRKCNPL
jgi:hypothetical protein